MTTKDHFGERKIQWSLEAAADGDRQWIVCIDSLHFIVGRADECNLKLIDNRISRRHAEVRVGGDLLWIRDLDSTNGTFVNHKIINKAKLLEPDDIISIGKYDFKVKAVYPSASDTLDETMTSTFFNDVGVAPDLEPKLRKLIRDRDVIPYFQSLIRFDDQTLQGYEILGRISDPDLPDSPATLLDMAEWMGCASELSSLFREKGVEVGTRLPESPILFINTTALEMYNMENLYASLKRIRTIAPAGKIILEINERAATETMQIHRLRQILKEVDMGLAFDDFGVGQTRLVDLARMPPDYLKFDISLIRQIHLAPKRLHQMITTFIKASHSLGITTLAEGVEHAEEAHICKQLGFDLAQGYFYGKPAPIERILMDLKKKIDGEDEIEFLPDTQTKANCNKKSVNDINYEKFSKAINL